VRALERLGGVADRAALLRLTSRRRLRAAVEDDLIGRPTRDHYVLPTAHRAKQAAADTHGVASHLSAAAHWGWELLKQPDRPHVTVRRGRMVATDLQKKYAVHWAALADDEVDGRFTAPIRTVLDCARNLPFGDALAVADSALRHGLDADALRAAAAKLRGPGSTHARRVVAAADGRAANAFESALRALAIKAGMTVEPQVELDTPTGAVWPDLVDRSRRIVIEADSWTWHARHERQHDRDCERCNALVVAGWRVLRFTRDQVMSQPDYVRDTLCSLMARAS